ncbi:MAG: hypothetical protein WAS56_06650 [Saprospiraceae bacterium]
MDILKALILTFPITLGLNSNLCSQDFPLKSFEYYHFEDRPLNPFELNKYDSIVLYDSFNYFLENSNDAELLKFLKWLGLSYAMQIELINLIITKYPNNESFLLNNLDLIAAHPNSIRPNDINNYPIASKIVKDTTLSLKLGEFLVNSDYTKSFIQKKEIIETKKNYFVNLIENYSNKSNNDSVKIKCKDIISSLNILKIQSINLIEKMD